MSDKPAKVYAVVSYDMLEYAPSMSVRAVYATREAAEENCPDSTSFDEYEIEEWEVLQ